MCEIIIAAWITQSLFWTKGIKSTGPYTVDWFVIPQHKESLANPQSQPNFRPEQTKMSGLTESIELRVVGQDGTSIHFYMNQVLVLVLEIKCT